jgi:hypothetical protein
MEVPTPFPGGPYLVAALLCEKVLEEKDGVKTLVRVIDRVFQQVLGPEPPSQMPPLTLNLALYVRFRSGKAAGPSRVTVRLVRPSGESSELGQLTLYFEEGDAKFVDLVANLHLNLDQPGQWWFEVYLQDQRVAAVPLEVRYLPARVPAP